MFWSVAYVEELVRFFSVDSICVANEIDSKLKQRVDVLQVFTVPLLWIKWEFCAIVGWKCGTVTCVPSFTELVPMFNILLQSKPVGAVSDCILCVKCTFLCVTDNLVKVHGISNVKKTEFDMSPARGAVEMSVTINFYYVRLWSFIPVTILLYVLSLLFPILTSQISMEYFVFRFITTPQRRRSFLSQKLQTSQPKLSSLQVNGARHNWVYTTGVGW